MNHPTPLILEATGTVPVIFTKKRSNQIAPYFYKASVSLEIKPESQCELVGSEFIIDGASLNIIV